MLFVKNEWKLRLHIWANDTYQGYVDPGQVAYMPQEGFVTLDSGLQPDGAMKMDHAYGGWAIRDTFQIVGSSVPFVRDGTTVSFYSEGSQSDTRGVYKKWTFGATAEGLSPPEGVETENAVKMRQAREPRDIQTLIEKGKSEVKGAEKTIVGLVSNNGTNYKLYLAGKPSFVPPSEFVGSQDYDSENESGGYRFTTSISGKVETNGRVLMRGVFKSATQLGPALGYKWDYSYETWEIDGFIEGADELGVIFSGKIARNGGASNTVNRARLQWEIKTPDRSNHRIIPKVRR